MLYWIWSGALRDLMLTILIFILLLVFFTAFLPSFLFLLFLLILIFIVVVGPPCIVALSPTRSQLCWSAPGAAVQL